VKPYSAITVNPLNVTVLANGSVLVPTDNGTIVRIDATPTGTEKRSQGLDFVGW
jgi:hypothetical protein